MTTKEQERKALEQIRKIVEGLGEDSYVATAFEGCFEDAKENIENDWACSMNGRWQDAKQKIEKLERRIERLLAENEAKAAEIKRLQEDNYCLKNTVEDLTKQRDKAEKAKDEAVQKGLEAVMEERKDVTVEAEGAERHCTSFAKVEYFNNDGFRFINVVQKSGWVNSYRIDDLKTLVIE